MVQGGPLPLPQLLRTTWGERVKSSCWRRLHPNPQTPPPEDYEGLRPSKYPSKARSPLPPQACVRRMAMHKVSINLYPKVSRVTTQFHPPRQDTPELLLCNAEYSLKKRILKNYTEWTLGKPAWLQICAICVFAVCLKKCRCKWLRPWPSSFRRTLHARKISGSKASCWPRRSGQNPLGSSAFTEANHINFCTMQNAFSAVHSSVSWAVTLSLCWGLWARSSTTKVCPEYSAKSWAVLPWLRAFASAPAASSWATTGTCPSPAATAKGLKPFLNDASTRMPCCNKQLTKRPGMANSHIV